MKKILLFLIPVLIFSFFAAQEVKAGAADNVWGWAWSENIGWISFNSTNTGAAVNYGVNIDPSTGIFSGNAWSRGTDADVGGVGWISFADYNGDGVVNSSDNICPSGTCQAKLDFGTNEVSGWARALSATSSPGDWDGWIKLRGTTYGVSLNSSTKEFEGWAWGGDDSTSTAVIGWISFNCKDGGYNEGTEEHYDICGTSNYKVMTSVSLPPYTSNLRIDTVNWDACANGGIQSLYPLLSWDYNDGTQKSYQIQIATSPDFTTTKICDYTADSSAHQSYPNTCPLTYNTDYNWRLKVWNTEEVESAWNGSTFTTPPHRYPNPSFGFNDRTYGLGEMVTFSDQSTCYNPSNYPCATGGSISYLWDFGDNATSSQKGTTTHAYTTQGKYPVKLFVTDSSIPTPAFPNPKCTSGIIEVRVGSRLPEWKEIKPF